MARRLTHKNGRDESAMAVSCWTTRITGGNLNPYAASSTQLDDVTCVCGCYAGVEIATSREWSNGGFASDSNTLKVCVVHSRAVALKVHDVVDGPRFINGLVDIEHDLTGDQVVATGGDTESLVRLVEAHPSIHKGMNGRAVRSVLILCTLPPLLIATGSGD